MTMTLLLNIVNYLEIDQIMSVHGDVQQEICETYMVAQNFVRSKVDFFCSVTMSTIIILIKYRLHN